MNPVAGVFELHGGSCVTSRILDELGTAAGRAEVVRSIAIVSPLVGGCRVDVHSAYRVSDQLRPWLRSAGVSAQHLDAAGGDETPGQHRHKQEKRDVEKGRVVPARLCLENAVVVIGRSP